MDSIGESKTEFHIPGRILNKPVFPTESNKAKFIYHPIPNLHELQDNEFQLLSVRSEGQFNTVVYEEKDLYRNQDRRDVVLMNKDDMILKNKANEELSKIFYKNAKKIGKF